MPWNKWGQADLPAVELDEPVVVAGLLAAVRYCPRCDTSTQWTNGHDHGLRLACAGCGYLVGAALTDEEQDRAEAYDATPVRRRRRAYRHV